MPWPAHASACPEEPIDNLQSAPVRLLLADCRRIDGTLLPMDGLLATWSPVAAVTHDSPVVDCEPFETEEGSVVSNLLIRPFFHGDDLDRALRDRSPIPIIAYWRRCGFAWSRRSVHFAQRFRLGVGGSLMATLVPLLEDSERI